MKYNKMNDGILKFLHLHNKFLTGFYAVKIIYMGLRFL